jgi:hypothetical protein
MIDAVKLKSRHDSTFKVIMVLDHLDGGGGGEPGGGGGMLEGGTVIGRR